MDAVCGVGHSLITRGTGCQSPTIYMQTISLWNAVSMILSTTLLNRPATRSPRLAGQSWAAHETIQGH
jgi:hypothetical protein